jgi:ribitol 2-dehydrogenase
MNTQEEEDMNELQGKVSAVTGAASGIGLASAEAMISAGAKVVLVDRDEKALQAVCDRLGDRAIPLVIDLLNPDQCASLLDGVLSKAGQLDILHANAGTYIGGDLTETNLDAIDRMLNLNVNVVMKNVRSVIPHMIERGTGDIIITSSVAGHTAVPWEPVYSASKWAMTSFVQTMRRQLLKSGIRVGSVSPGPVISALLADWPEENLRKAKDSGGLIEPKEVAEAVIFMLSRPRTVTIRDIVILPSAFDI